MQTIDVADEIDWMTPRSSTANRQCRVCDGLYKVALDYDGPPLCPDCASDPEATKRRVQAWINSVCAQMDEATLIWDRIRSAAQVNWDKLQDARSLPDYAERCDAHRAAGNVYGQLLDAEARYERELAALGEERARLERAEMILRNI